MRNRIRRAHAGFQGLDVEIRAGTALVIAVAVLALLEVLIGYGNSYQSCLRTANTRENSNIRVEHAAVFWENEVSGSREDMAGMQRALAAQLNDPNMQVRDPALARSLRAIASGMKDQADANDRTAAGFRSYAAQLRRDEAQVPDCDSILPPSD